MNPSLHNLNAGLTFPDFISLRNFYDVDKTFYKKVSPEDERIGEFNNIHTDMLLASQTSPEVYIGNKKVTRCNQICRFQCQKIVVPN